MKKLSLIACVALLGVVACNEKVEPEAELTDPVAFGTVEYEGVTYKTVTYMNGQTWMAENLRYVPEGKKVSDGVENKESGIWYPYTTDGEAGTASKDEALIKTNGYLYTVDAVFGLDLAGATAEEKDAAYKKCEGARGICPEGWHIPTLEECTAFCGYQMEDAGNKPDTLKAVTIADAPIYDTDMKKGSIKKANEIGFNYVAAGCTIAGKYNKGIISKGSYVTDQYVGKPLMSYIMCSTVRNDGKGSKFWAIMNTFNPTYKGSLHMAHSMVANGIQVRCIKNN